MTTIHGVNLLTSFIVLLLLSGATYLTVFAPNQLHALVMLFLDAYTYGFTIGVVFLALHAFILGYLIFKSGYFPKILGVLFIIAAFGYLIDSFSHALFANYKTGAVYLAIPIAIAEIAFPLWLLFKGVNAEQWEKRALESACYNPCWGIGISAFELGRLCWLGVSCAHEQPRSFVQQHTYWTVIRPKEHLYERTTLAPPDRAQLHSRRLPDQRALFHPDRHL